MLDKEGKNIDACTIGIPDFMHATVALACMQRGKHVYVEKPLTRTPWEARLLQEAAAKYKVATQMGNQGFSHECHRVAAEIVWSGAIGDVTEAHISTTPGTHPTGLQELPPGGVRPANAGLGLVARRRARCVRSAPTTCPTTGAASSISAQARLATGPLTPRDPCTCALQLGAPTSVERVERRGDSKITFPDRAIIRLDFPARGGMPPVKVFYHDSSRAGDAGSVSRSRHGERDHSAAGQQSGRQGSTDGRPARCGTAEPPSRRHRRGARVARVP